MLALRDNLNTFLRLLMCLLLVGILVIQWITLNTLNRISSSPVQVINDQLGRRPMRDRVRGGPLDVSVSEPIEVIIVGVNR